MLDITNLHMRIKCGCVIVSEEVQVPQLLGQTKLVKYKGLKDRLTVLVGRVEGCWIKRQVSYSVYYKSSHARGSRGESQY